MLIFIICSNARSPSREAVRNLPEYGRASSILLRAEFSGKPFAFAVERLNQREPLFELFL